MKGMKTNKVMGEEIWVEMWGFPTYEISNLGNVRNAKTEKVLKARSTGRDYRMICIFYHGKVYTKRIGRYVWMSFNKQYCDGIVIHINEDHSDDRLENLNCICGLDHRKSRQNYEVKNKYNLTNEDKGYIHNSITGGTETTWTIMKKYNVPLNYISTTIKRGSWAKYGI